MTVDRISAEWVEKAAAVLLAEGAAPGNSIHSWRCEYPETYDACKCVEVTAAEIIAAVVDDIRAQALRDAADAARALFAPPNRHHEREMWAGWLDARADEATNPYRTTTPTQGDHHE